LAKLHDENEIIRRCQQGEIAAFEKIFQHYKQPMYSVARGVLSRHEDAEDALQEAFVRTYRYIAKFQFKSSFSTWLYRIVINTCYDQLRKIRRSKEQNFNEAIDIAEHNTSIETKMNLEQALSMLPKKMRTCFVLFAVQGFKQEEVADIMNTKVGTVKSQVFAAKQKLRQIMT